MLSQTPQRTERLVRLIAVACILFCIGGPLVMISAIPALLQGSTIDAAIGAVWYSLLLAVFVRTYYDLVRRFVGRIAVGKAVNPWIQCFVLNALWISNVLSTTRPISQAISTSVIVSAVGSMILAGVGFAVEMRGRSTTRRLHQG